MVASACRQWQAKVELMARRLSSGAGVPFNTANKPEIWIEEPEEEEPTGPNDAALLASGVPESHLAAQRKKQRRAAQAAGEAPPDWQPSDHPRETAPIHA
jgi:hypothetical protein